MSLPPAVVVGTLRDTGECLFRVEIAAFSVMQGEGDDAEESIQFDWDPLHAAVAITRRKLLPGELVDVVAVSCGVEIVRLTLERSRDDLGIA